MNSAASEPALIGVDWGTSSLRAFLIAADGEVIDSVASSEGIMQIDDQSFEEVLDRLIAPWAASTDLPVMASGMITSRNGWVETPYAELPLGAPGLGGSLVRHQTANGTAIHFVTGASTEHAGGPDVMRGEEAQIIGAAALGLREGLFVMPGTHSKWVRVADGEIIDFSTCMTGEVFSALKEHTILGALMKEGGFDEGAFVAGVKAGFADASKLLLSLFHVRTMPLMGKISEKAAADYMSGLLIGTEIVAAMDEEEDPGMITIIGRSDLSNRYETALRSTGHRCGRAPENIAAKGHFEIAQAAGILG